MLIASFNCNSIRARMPVIKRWLSSVSPDILCLQETKVTDNEFPASELLSGGFHSVYKGEKSYNGVAILSKVKPSVIHYGFDGTGDDEGSRLIAVKIGGVNIINTYIPQGVAPDSEKFQYKLNWFARIGDFIGGNYKKKDPLIWLGDFNVAPEPIDVHNPKRLLGSVGFHPDEHKALSGVKDWGFIDLFRKFNPEGGHYTFWDYRVKDAIPRGLGWRVDHIWGTKYIESRTIKSWIDIEPRLWERPSDHTPVLAEVDI